MPWRWMSLETLERRVYTQASDIWSFGVVMWEIFSFGMMPYQTLENDQILKFLQEVKNLKKMRNFLARKKIGGQKKSKIRYFQPENLTSLMLDFVLNFHKKFRVIG